MKFDEIFREYFSLSSVHLCVLCESITRLLCLRRRQQRFTSAGANIRYYKNGV